MPDPTPYVSTNPVFVNFSVPADKAVSINSTDQMSRTVMRKLSEPRGAKMGYGIGYAGLPNAVNISWDGPDLPFSDPMSDVPWGEAVLCEGTLTDGKLALVELEAAGANRKLIHGTCYGVTIKDCSVQLNAGISIAATATGEVTKTNANGKGLYLAILANAVIDDEGVLVATDGHKKDPEAAEEDGTGVASTVVAVSEAIDPTVFGLSDAGMKFVIPKATAGYKFVVTGTLLKAPHFSDPGAYCSMKDTVSSYPTALSIVDAKTASNG